RPVVLEHLLDEVDASAGAVELIAKQHIGRACCGAKSAVHTGAEYLLRLRRRRILQLLGREIRLHELVQTFPDQKPGATSADLMLRRSSAPNPKFAQHLRHTRSRTSGSKGALES